MDERSHGAGFRTSHGSTLAQCAQPLAGKNSNRLRKLLPASYNYLFRNDREWLEQNRPPAPTPPLRKDRVNWNERDRLVASKIKQIYQDGGFNQTTGKISALLGVGDMLRKHKGRLPLSWKEIERFH